MFDPRIYILSPGCQQRKPVARNLSAFRNARARIFCQIPIVNAYLFDPHIDITFGNCFQMYDWRHQTWTSCTGPWNGVMTGCPSGSTLRYQSSHGTSTVNHGVDARTMSVTHADSAFFCFRRLRIRLVLANGGQRRSHSPRFENGREHQRPRNNEGIDDRINSTRGPP